MWKELWRKWTLDKPAAFGDWLWQVLVVELAALLDRITLRDIIAFIPVVILVVAYGHSIPIPPELMLLGDLLAYIDIYAVLFLIGILGRVTNIVFFFKQSAAYAARLANTLLAGAKGLDFHHRRESGAKSRKSATRAKNENDDPAGIFGLAWA
jgi:hypothetical protein